MYLQVVDFVVFGRPLVGIQLDKRRSNEIPSNHSLMHCYA